MDNLNRPLVTFALFAYNQAAYVRQAVEWALAQDYSPLEIILSDDASSDATASIIREVVHEYRGPHTVIVNVNKTNLGIGAHVNQMFRMATGDLLILAAGDDLSLPERTSRTVDFWLKNGRVPCAIYCGGQKIDADGNALGPVRQHIQGPLRDAHYIISRIHDGDCVVLGACSAYTPNVISHFGELANDLGIEDTPLAVRASLLGGIEYIDETLVHYRVNVSVWRNSKRPGETFTQHLRRLSHLTHALHFVFRQILFDAANSGDKLAIEAATRRYVASSFATNCYAAKRFSLKGYITTMIRSRQWKNPLLLGIMYSYPGFHRAVFYVQRLIRWRPRSR